jgi:mono/diheme cytochrome c family protein
VSRGALLLAGAIALLSCAHPPGPAASGPAPAAAPSSAPAAAVERGKALYALVCGFCHGMDARGGEQGPNLLHSEVVLKDKQGDLITPIVQNGRPEKGMPKVDFTNAQVADIAAFIHTFRITGYDRSRMRPPSIVVGDAAAGKAYFESRCARCHSVTGDLKGVGARFRDAKALQQAWLMPRDRAVRVTVTQPNQRALEGRLEHIDDFVVGLTADDGVTQTVRLSGKVKVKLDDPLQPHRELLAGYTDRDVHDVTAFLVGIK